MASKGARHCRACKRPEEFRDDTVHAALELGPSTTLVWSPRTLDKWLRQAHIEAREQERIAWFESAELHEPEEHNPATGAGEPAPAPVAARLVAGKSTGKRLRPPFRELAAQRIPAAAYLRELKLSATPHYRWLKESAAEEELTWGYHANALFDADRDDPELGYRPLPDEARKAGEAM